MKIIVDTDSYKLINMISRTIKRYQKEPTTGGDFRVNISVEFSDSEATPAKGLIKATLTKHKDEPK
jgi:hypothetical protein